MSSPVKQEQVKNKAYGVGGGEGGEEGKRWLQCSGHLLMLLFC